MKIGITYDLKEDYLREGYSTEETAELDSIETIDAIDETLLSLGHTTDRIGNIKALVGRLARRDSWDLVFNIAEGVRGIGRESQVPALLDAYGIPYTFSDPLVLALTLHKGMAKRVLRNLGVPTPDFVVVEQASDLDDVTASLTFPMFAKPVAEGTGKGISEASKINSGDELRQVCLNLLTRFNQPVLVEAYLPGREFTVGIVGTGSKAKAVGTMEVTVDSETDPEIYSYANKAHWEDRVHYRLIHDPARMAEEVALAAWRGLGCRDAGRVDLRCAADGEVQFMEVNPLAGLNPVWSDLPILCRMAGISYRELIVMIIRSSLDRVADPRAGEEASGTSQES